MNSLRSYGYNMQVIFRLDSGGRAIEHLGEQFFSERVVRLSGKTLVGGTASLVLRDGAIQWTFAANPWPNGDPNADRVALSVNRHTENPSGPPSRDRMVGDFLDVREEAQKFMRNLNAKNGEN